MRRASRAASTKANAEPPSRWRNARSLSKVAMGKTLVCRCEDVTEHELVEAIARGHRDIESLKRYSGFGTGFCQGKWCLALCADVLERHGGTAEVPFTPRPPYHPVTLAHLEGTVAPSEGEGPGEL